MLVQPASSFETSAFVRCLPQSKLPNSSLACTSAAWLKLRARAQPGSRFVFHRAVKGTQLLFHGNNQDNAALSGLESPALFLQ